MPALQLFMPAVCEGVGRGTYAGGAGVQKRTCDIRLPSLLPATLASAGVCVASATWHPAGVLSAYPR